MKNKTRLFIAFFGFMSLAPGLRADEVPVLSVDDTEAIVNHMDREVIVEGKVHSAFWVRNQVMLITFREREEGFLAVVFAGNRRKLNEAFGGDMAKALGGKSVRISGTVSEYRSRPQIVIDEPEQLSILDEHPDE
ncbi:MAG: hypothetical protein JJU29_22320 [Verrucomicrobia bacterium]|nr:hypothetical protein [Verrucomicrobiota bacterium]MCH8512783.1 hypothetical protein [Kiritimatiellia bacterium]